MHKTYLICFNASRGNRDKFFEILAEGKLIVRQVVNQIDGSGVKEIPVYLAKIECDCEIFLSLAEVLTGFSDFNCE